MIKYTFNYSGNPIYLTSEKKLSKDIADVIYGLIENLSFDLNHSVYNSSAFIFNETKPGSIASVSKEFINFLLLNLDLASKYYGFYPFVSEKNKFTGVDDIGKYIQVDLKNNKFVKSESIMFDTTFLRTALILDSIVEFLKNKKVLNILISHAQMHRALGSKSWDIEHEVDDEKLNLQLANQTSSLQFKSSDNMQQNKNFISIDKPLNHKYLVIKGNEGFINNEVLHEIAKNLFMESDYGNFCFKHDIEMVAVDDNKQRFNFSKQNMLSV